MRNPLPQPLRTALTYLRALLSSRTPKHWDKLKRDINSTPPWDLPIAQRWRQILEEEWTSIPNTPPPIALDRATRHQSITSAFNGTTRTPNERHKVQPAEITLHFPTPRQRRSYKRKSDFKRKAITTIEPLRGSDANGEIAGISLILARSTPRRIHHNIWSAYVEEFIVQWDPEDCTLEEAQQQQMQGFVITSITSLDDGVPTALLEAATAAKRPRGRPGTADRPSPDTGCRVQFAPSPQGPAHIRTIKGGEAALEAFLLTETTATRTSPPRRQGRPNPPPPQTETILAPCAHIRPTAAAATPPSPGRPTAHTRTCSKYYLKKVTRIGTPPHAMDPTPHLSPRHPLGTHWERR
jgi:hypothetical protein